MRERPVRPVENYTKPFLVMAYVVVFTLLLLVWDIWGYATALILGVSGIGLLRLWRR
ncbi:hypothetical protein Ga0609869_000226 [Rhodovulum iodosum]|uniref:Uncharacterized protein n=1 Tax=Rhodovulum iodosum TaxID=68291 RepID=A0ABV3XNJ0_9RHOB|nr:hypothetical protein [Rhodovulum robiginosum]